MLIKSLIRSLFGKLSLFRPQLQDETRKLRTIDIKSLLRRFARQIEFEKRTRLGDSPPHDGTEHAWPDINGYTIEEELGTGGWGTVYKARGPEGQKVALKVLRKDFKDWEKDKLLQLFRNEARNLKKLHHANIVRSFEFIDDGIKSTLVMEYVKGQSLVETWKSRPSPRDAARIVRLLAQAIHYAHERGILHLDLSLGNVLLTDDQEPKIIDFGFSLPEDDDSRSTASEEITGSRALIGTPGFVAPERYQSEVLKNLKRSTDIYSLGVILYFALTGRLPVRTKDLVKSMLDTVFLQPVTPRTHYPQVPEMLEAICMKCIQKWPGHRYASACDLAEDLERFAAGRRVQAKPSAAVVACQAAVGAAPFLFLAAFVVLLGIAFRLVLYDTWCFPNDWHTLNTPNAMVPLPESWHRQHVFDAIIAGIATWSLLTVGLLLRHVRQWYKAPSLLVTGSLAGLLATLAACSAFGAADGRLAGLTFGIGSAIPIALTLSFMEVAGDRRIRLSGLLNAIRNPPGLLVTAMLFYALSGRDSTLNLVEGNALWYFLFVSGSFLVLQCLRPWELAGVWPSVVVAVGIAILVVGIIAASGGSDFDVVDGAIGGCLGCLIGIPLIIVSRPIFFRVATLCDGLMLGIHRRIDRFDRETP